MLALGQAQPRRCGCGGAAASAPALPARKRNLRPRPPFGEAGDHGRHGKPLPRILGPGGGLCGGRIAAGAAQAPRASLQRERPVARSGGTRARGLAVRAKPRFRLKRGEKFPLGCWCTRPQTCVLTVWHMHGPGTAADGNYDTFVQDEEHVTQRGPYCAAASVAGMVLSFAAELGGPEEAAARTCATQEAVVQLMRGFGVPGLERSTARVGNVTWKRAMRMATIADDPEKGLLGGQVRFAPRDLEPCGPVPVAGADGRATEADGVEAGGEGPSAEALAAESDALWERLRSDMAAGARVMYHCANHYTRVFGWRQSRPGVDADALGGPVDGPGSEADRGLAAEAVGGDSDGEEGPPAQPAGGQSRGAGRGRPAAPLFDWGRHRSRAGCRREVLTAKRGQGPKHWVSWEQVVADVRKHKLHRLFSVSLVDRRSRARRARAQLASDARAGNADQQPDAKLRADAAPCAPSRGALLI